MKIPQTLKIGGHTYTVEFVSRAALDDINTNTDQGACNVNDCIIYINQDQTESQKEETLIHEVLHAINFELDHALLTSLAAQLHQVLSDNKLLK